MSTISVTLNGTIELFVDIWRLLQISITCSISRSNVPSIPVTIELSPNVPPLPVTIELSPRNDACGFKHCIRRMKSLSHQRFHYNSWLNRVVWYLNVNYGLLSRKRVAWVTSHACNVLDPDRNKHYHIYISTCVYIHTKLFVHRRFIDRTHWIQVSLMCWYVECLVACYPNLNVANCLLLISVYI